MTKNPKFLLYELGKVPRRLEETVLSEKGIKEKYIQNFFKENLSKVFNLIFLKEEHYLTNPDTGKKDFRADTLAFSKRGFFIIIEYKRGESLELYQQASGYISCLNDMENKEECIHNRYELLNILKEEEKSSGWSYKNILWKETRGICITTEIGKRLQHHQRQKNEDIKILEIKFYDHQKILYIDTNSLPEWLTIAKNIESNNSKNNGGEENNKTLWNLEKILTSNWIQPEIKDLLSKIVKLSWLKKLIPKVKAKFFSQNQLYGFDIEYREKNQKKMLYSAEIWKGQINFWFNFGKRQKISEKCVDFLVSYKLNNKSESTYWSLKRIKTSADFQNLANFFQEYREKFSQDEIKT